MSAFINKLFFNSSPTSNQDLDSLSKLSNDAGPSTDAKTLTCGEPKIPMSTKSILKLPSSFRPELTSVLAGGNFNNFSPKLRLFIVR